MTKDDLNGIIETIRVERVGGLDPNDLIELHALALKGLESFRPEAERKVFIVTCGWAYEGSDVKAVVATSAEAHALVEKYGDPDKFGYDSIDVEEWTVGEVTDKRWERSSTPQVE